MFWIRSCLALAIGFGFSIAAGADDLEKHWHQWRGPGGNGVAASAQPPLEWAHDSKNLKWKTVIPGKGSSSPVVWGDRIFVLTAVETDRTGEAAGTKPDGDGNDRGRRGRRRRPAPTNYYEFRVVCIDRDTGNQLWSTTVNEAIPHESGHSTNTFASASPVTDGERVYAHFNSFGLYCLDMEGRVLWDRQFGKMQTRAAFGEGASPGLYGDTLVVNWDHEGQSFIEALDASTGETKWKTDRDEPTSWSTPAFAEYDGGVQVITNGATRVRSYDLSNGKLIWECGGQTGNPVPTPMVIDDMAICMTGFRASAAYAIPLGSKGDVTNTDQVVWSRQDIGPYVPTGVLYEGQIYSTRQGSPVLTAIDAANGQTIIDKSRLDGIRTIYASLVAANGHVYVTGRSGKTVVLKHGPELQVVATNDLGEPVDATPALVDNQIIIRGDTRLFCFEAN